ncbi:hotdog domain-containing protein (plasmid) [Streptomyces sp. HUAS 31]|uniref:acyl-CoA thioesterase n=1 Tax=Streptomyces TaxID=1883 RepID=UPI0023064D62|nr:thioesterase family protein [Streptomyces sp. HUAS 31]WCE02421.1 hotdog domain-containing protein [Streptomyces sp. HUAS 31]
MTCPSTTHQVQVRWPDIDALGHVNHSTVLVYLEVGRDAVLSACGIEPRQVVVRHCAIDYVRELRPRGSHVEYRLDALEPGRTSLRIEERLMRGGETAVSSTFVLVLWDDARRAARELTPDERHALSTLRKDG